MANHEEKLARKAAVTRELARRRQQTQRESPLSRDELDALLDFLSEEITANGHDGTFLYTLQWLDRTGKESTEVIAFLNSRKMHCDFDVIYDGDPNKLFGPSSDRLARMPISRRDLEGLITFVDNSCRRSGCDRSTRYTLRWLLKHQLPIATTEIALLAQGGGCDCEVVLNVDPDNIYPPDSSP